jgi:virulence-associated protein VapD
MEIEKIYSVRRAINFDLSMKALDMHYSKNRKDAYSEIKTFF